jgi:dihydrodipicolinate synthase/N-acetylneuraminate lyase
MRRITAGTVETIAAAAETFTDGQFRYQATGTDIGHGARYIDGKRADLTWLGKNGGSSQAAAYYIGGMLGWAKASGTMIPDDVRELCQAAQALYAKRANAPYWEEQGRKDAAGRYEVRRSR